ncbi:hypothetical protein PHLGIDRAFT_127644 [Phlebiopsis gigantea 11061_1 CR5-6]|uniref:Uncharacterized protein n=1 Tax=Phlebiopsis gigantea (strain 11061_1 CR5-6) TaxID=745531 RepID=A0A0C3PLR0_PHLG1|nr:hypothetical protein PHLGIDRAFT_127644 [Phlebiopsis gigantea 11061_1 CR5-6]
MVVLSPNFTVLASLSALAVVSMLPTGAEAIALPSTPQRSSHSRRPNAATTEGRNGGNSYTPDVKGKDADSSSSPIPALSLPGLPKRGTFGVEHSPTIDKRWDPTNPLFELGDLWLGSGASPKTRRDGDSDVVVSGTNDHVHVSHHYHGGKVVVSGDDEHVHLHRRSPTPDPHHHNHGSHDTMVVSGDDDHVNVHMKRSPRSRHHHDDKIVVSGDHDHVDAHMRRSPHEHHGHYDKIVVSGDHDHVNVHTRRSPHEHHDKVVVSGNHDHVDVHHKRSPHSHHHHDSVIVSGDDDHVNVHHKRAATRYRHYRPHLRRSPDGAVTQDDSGVSIPLLDKDRTVLVPALQRRDPGLLGDDVVMTDHDTILNVKRQVMSAFAEPEGVPGTIDIMSNVAGSSVGQRIASLTLSSTMGNDVLGNADPFVLNASGTNQTQIYMVVLPDDDDSSDPGSPSNSTGPASTTPPSNSTSSANSTSPGNSTSTNAPSASFAPSAISSMDVDPASNTTAPSNSTTPSNSTSSSTSTPPQYKKVALKIPLFDAESATMRAFCATFDPQPSAPSPLTVESCANGPLDDKHKSQVFAFDPSTGAIQPMWYEGGEGDGYTGDDGDDQDDTGDNTDTPPVDDSPTPANVTSTAAVDSTVARIASLSDKLMDNDSTIRPPTPNVAANAHAFAAGQYVSAQNVTLMFAPLTPELSSHAASEERMAGSSSSPSSTSTTGSASATVTNASPDPVSTTITFSSASATSMTSPTDTSSSMSTAGISTASVAFAPASATSTSSSASATDSSTAPSGSSPATDSLTATSSASATSTTDSTTSSATSSDASASLSVHSLGVEVFDPNATPSSSDVSTATATDGSSAASSTVTSSVQAAGAPTMTPYSTAPYEWMFKQSS